MPSLSIKEVSEHFENIVDTSLPVKFSTSEISSAIRRSVEQGEINQLERFIHSNLSFKKKDKPNKGFGELLLLAYAEIASYAFMADKHKDSATWMELVKAYSNESDYGPAMKFVRYLVEKAEINLDGILEGNIKTSFEKLTIH